MTTAALHPAGRVEAALVALLLGLAAAAWVLTSQRMEGMDMGPGTELGSFGWFAVTWGLMMAAMMLPSLTPMVAAYRRRGTAGGSAVFAIGYLAAWAGAGLVAYAAIEAVRALDLGFLAWDEAGRYVAAGTILGAGAYQLTSPKAGCLRRCREREEFVADHWRRLADLEGAAKDAEVDRIEAEQSQMVRVAMAARELQRLQPEEVRS